MKRFAILLLIVLAAPAWGQEASKLEFKGKTEIIKVERIVRVWDDRLSLKEFPFTLEAPVGAIRPSWTVPAGVTWTRKGRLIEITAAPKGELKISADWAVLDKKTLDITEDFDTFTLLVGGVSPPPPPPPTPSPLQKVLQVAYDVEADQAKATNVLKFADILEGSVAAAKAGGRVKTAGDFVTLTKQATDLAIGAAAIPGIRKSVGNYLQTVLPREANTPANDAYFAKVASEHGYVALALRGLK